MIRLSRRALSALPDEIGRPAYDRDATSVGVVHLGLGAFHRAHQAAIFDAALRAGDPRWAISGVSLRSPAVREQLLPQDGLYSLIEKDGAKSRARVIGAIRDVLVAPENPQAVVAALASPDAHLVTLTITEKGYRLAGNVLDETDPEVGHDLAGLSAPRTAAGLLVAGLAQRRAAGLAPFTVLSCDNLPHNGRLLRDSVLSIAAAHDAALTEWIARHGAFPQTTVDRIVPATTEPDIAALAASTGVEDRAMVKTEPFLQWVIEDRFCGPRPGFESLGVQLTKHIAPWEDAKLRLLNGAHSAIAYLGGLAGITFVHQFVALPEGRALIEALWEESAATLTPPPEMDLVRYRAALMGRFVNDALEHCVRQIATDGSQKLPQRLLVPALLLAGEGRSCPALALAIAAWMRWQIGCDDAGRPFIVDDPLAHRTSRAIKGTGAAHARVDALLAIEAIFPCEVRSSTLREQLVEQLERLEAGGALVAIRRVLATKG